MGLLGGVLKLSRETEPIGWMDGWMNGWVDGWMDR